MNHRTALVVLALLVTLPALTACSIRQDYPDTRRYALEVRRDAPAREAIPGVRLLVSSYDISRRYEGEQMVYRLDDGTWESDFYHRFFVAPVEMISEETRRWFSDSGMAGAVLDAGSLVEPTHAVEGMVTAVYGDYGGDDGPHAVLEIQLFGLGRSEDGPARILTAGNYTRRIPVEDETSPALVAGWEQALAEILTDFEERFAKAVAEDRAEAAR